jgi:ATP-dependent DNA ligase
MLAQPLEIGLDKHRNQWQRVIQEEYWMEPKLDGMRCILVFDHGILQKAYTRSGRDIRPQLARWYTRMTRLSLTVLDCELGYETDPFVIDFNRTMRVLGSGPEVAQDKMLHQEAAGNFLKGFVFDMPHVRGDQETRRSALWDLFEGMHPSSPLVMVPNKGLWSRAVYDECVQSGMEGVVLKNPNAEYAFASRPTQTWYKVKKYETTDAVIVGYDPGQGKYAGQIGAIVFQLEDGRVGHCSGMTDKQRQDITDYQVDLLGKWIEVRYFGGVGADKKGLRHPQFVRFRDAKVE